jgi:hypothetical protein
LLSLALLRSLNEKEAMAKPIVITDDSVVNSYGFRVLTDGGDYSDYLKNPVLLYDHTRRRGENDKDVILPIGTTTELQQMGTKLVATPEFDLEDEFAAEIARKYDKGIFNMASIGFEAIEWSEDPALMLPGQLLPTVTKWKLREVSITDIGANPNCCKLSHAGHTITLNDKVDAIELQNFFNSNKTQPTMKKVIAALNGSKLVTLSEASNEDLVAEAVVTLNSQLSAKEQALSVKDAEILRLTSELATAKTAAIADKATALVEGALASKKIVAAQKENFLKLASQTEEGYQSVKSLLDSMQAYTSVIPQLSVEDLPKSKAEQVKLYDLHAKEGTLKSLGADNIKVLWKAKHGTEIKDSTLNALIAQ